jgi:hypothetical protein
MNRTSALRWLLGGVGAIVIATSGPALAAGANTAHTRQAAAPATTACSPGQKACPIRITFAPGAYSGQAHSQLTGIHSKRWFVVNANAGQTMVVVVEGAGPTGGIVYFPNGQSNGQPGGRIFDDNLPVTGDYKIKVMESQLGEAWSGRVDVVVLAY